MKFYTGSAGILARKAQLEPMLGPKRFKDEQGYKKDEIGLVNGLAWTAVGGETSAPAGSVVEADKNGLAIACGDGRLLRVLELQGEGGKRMAAADYLRGHPVPLGL